MRIHLIDLSLPTPEENLALDEALLRQCDLDARDGNFAGLFRFWESPHHFVVLGVSRNRRKEVHIERCEQEGIPILRRASGGGTVLQGPGCLNWAVVLPIDENPRLRSIEASYELIVEKSVAALGVEGGAMKGSSDLAIGDLKFGGSAQKRTPRVVMHHASILYDFDLALISRTLREPPMQPEYRNKRSHGEFVTNLPLSAREIKSRLAAAWQAVPVAPSWTPPPVAKLVAEKYSREEWTNRF